MGENVDDLLRLALFERWRERCVWCRRPIHFNEMEIEHLLPKSLMGKDNSVLFEAHGLDPGFDLEGLENLAPSCGPCNREKGRRPPPEAPGVTNLLRTAQERAPEVRSTAAKLRSEREISRAVAVLRAGAAEGSEPALVALREAADATARDYQSVTGREVHRLHSALDRLAEAGEIISQSDPHFSYPAAVHEAEGPAPPVTPGSVMSVSETRGNVTSRIDVVPRDNEALERYGPQFIFSAAEGEAGERAAAKLEEALREGRSVEIEEGIEVTVERLPPALGDLVGQRLSGRLSLSEVGPPAERPPVPEWDAQLRVSAVDGRSASVRVRLRRTEEAPDGWDNALEAHYGGMTVKALMRSTGTGGEIRFAFTHQRDDSPVRDQLAALTFLEALSRGGEFVAVDRGRTRRPDFRMPIEPEEVAPEARALLAFLRDLRLLEEHAQVEFVLPQKIPGDQARHVALVAMLVRNGERTVIWEGAHLILPESGVDQVRDGGVMRIEATASAVVFGQEIELGTLRRDIAAYELVSVKPQVNQPGYVRVNIGPPNGEPTELREQLTRTVRTRRPPQAPKKQNRDRKKKQKKRKR